MSAAITRSESLNQDNFISLITNMRQSEGLIAKTARKWIDKRGYEITYRGQSSGTTPILSPLARTNGVEASEALLGRMRTAGMTDGEIASMTARFHGVETEAGMVRFGFQGEDEIINKILNSGLVGEKMGAVGIPTSKIPGIASSFAYSDEGVLFAIRLNKGKAVKPVSPRPELNFEEERVVFNQIADRDIFRRYSPTQVMPIKYDYSISGIANTYQRRGE